MNIIFIAGARPNFMKIAPILKALHDHNGNKKLITYKLVHTGQHFDYNMSESFFEQLRIPRPDVNLECGGGTQAEQTAQIMVKFEEYLMQHPADLVVVVGDVTSTMACSIVAQKLNTKVAHVEGGIRSGDWSMPEEINRIVTDSISNYFFTTTKQAGNILLQSGKKPEQIFFVGNTMIDTLLSNQERFIEPDFFEAFHLKPQSYFVLTLHRPSNVDNPQKFNGHLETIDLTAENIPVIFPVHPRTRKILANLNSDRFKNIYFVDPQPYLQFNYLVKYSKGVITDSGGITEEATVFQIPCITLRTTTERPETCEIGTNVLIGEDLQMLEKSINDIIDGKWKKGNIPELWDGKTAERIVDVLHSLSQ